MSSVGTHKAVLPSLPGPPPLPPGSSGTPALDTGGYTWSRGGNLGGEVENNVVFKKHLLTSHYWV